MRRCRTPAPPAHINNGPSGMAAAAQHARQQQDDGLDQFQHSAHGNSHNAKRQEQKAISRDTETAPKAPGAGTLPAKCTREENCYFLLALVIASSTCSACCWSLNSAFRRSRRSGVSSKLTPCSLI